VTSSLTLRNYLSARTTMERAEAAALVGMSLEEARLTDIANEKGQIDLPPWPSIPAAGHAATTGGAIIMAKETPNETESELDVDQPERDDPVPELAADTLRGDVRDSLLSWLKATPRPWSQMSEAEQKDQARAADSFSASLVREVCQIIAANERPCIVATLTEYKEKDGVEAKLKLPSKGEVVAALHEACGREVLIVTSGAEEYMGEAAPAEIRPDQPGLGIGDEYQEAA